MRLCARDVLRVAALGLLLVLSVAFAAAAEEPALLDPATHPKFVNPLPNPLDPSFIFQPDGTVPGPAGDEPYYQVGMFQFQQSLGLVDAGGNHLMTTVWGYGKSKATATYPGRSFIVYRDQPVNVRWTNNLVDDLGNPLPHFLPVDTTLHLAMPMSPPYPYSGVPVVAHVHGGHNESASDGLPEAWFTPGFAQKGKDWKKEVYHYPMDQQAGSIWYHDHALGLTRLNVYAGLAGFFLTRDEFDTGRRDNPLGLPSFPYEVPLVIQDRMFTADGQLYYPSAQQVPGGPEPSVEPEFFGDFILVNGQAWPVLDVEPRKYRLRLLNGSDSRFYTLWLAARGMTAIGTGPTLYQIGTDSGLLYAPVPLNQLTFGPGERADAIVDFAGFEGQTLVFRNNARAPFPKGETIDPRTAGQIMAFRVGTTVSDGANNALPAVLRTEPIAPLVPTAPTRKLILFEGEDEYGRLETHLGTTDGGPLRWEDTITENPMLNDVEVWEVYNTTEDAHPIHLHLVSFQIVDRQKFRAPMSEDGRLTRIHLIGRPQPPPANEAGWKDTVQMFPGQVTRIVAKFDREGLYVWHCHILSHEDHEMMRPFCVGDLSACESTMP